MMMKLFAPLGYISLAACAVIQPMLIALVGVLLFAGVTASAQVNDPALIAAATREGGGVVYTGGTPASADRLVRSFLSHFGIKLDTVRASSGPLSERFHIEWETGNNQADIVITSDELFTKDAVRNDWLGSIEDFPEAQAWPIANRTDRHFAVDAVPYPLVWNTNAQPNGLKGWKDLLDPKLRGRVMISDPRIVTSANGFYIEMRRSFGDDFLRQLGKQLGGLSPSANPGLQQIAAGANDVYAPGAYQTYLDLKAKGAPIAMTLGDPVIGSTFVAGWVTKAPHPNTAKLLIRFLMSPDGQAAYNEGSFSVLPNVPNTTPMPHITVVSGEEIAKQRPELIQLLGLN